MAASTAVARSLAVKSFEPGRSKLSSELIPLIAEERYLCTVSAMSRFVVACKCPAPNANIASLRKPYCGGVSKIHVALSLSLHRLLPAARLEESRTSKRDQSRTGTKDMRP
jgi:hypothetical protein